MEQQSALSLAGLSTRFAWVPIAVGGTELALIHKPFM